MEDLQRRAGGPHQEAARRLQPRLHEAAPPPVQEAVQRGGGSPVHPGEGGRGEGRPGVGVRDHGERDGGAHPLPAGHPRPEEAGGRDPGGLERGGCIPL